MVLSPRMLKAFHLLPSRFSTIHSMYVEMELEGVTMVKGSRSMTLARLVSVRVEVREA